MLATREFVIIIFQNGTLLFEIVKSFREAEREERLREPGWRWSDKSVTTAVTDYRFQKSKRTEEIR